MDMFLDTHLESSTRRTDTSPRPAGHSASELRSIGMTIYQEVWDQFYSWEPGDASRMLSNIKDKPPTFPLKAGLTTMARDMAKMYRGKTRCSQEMHRTQESTAGAWLVIVTEHSVTGKMMTKMDALPVIVLHDDLLSPHPPYECCTPTHRSVLVGPEGEENVVRFLPYADDASFPVKQYLKKFSRLEWEEDFDPDRECYRPMSVLIG